MAKDGSSFMPQLSKIVETWIKEVMAIGITDYKLILLPFRELIGFSPSVSTLSDKYLVYKLLSMLNLVELFNVLEAHCEPKTVKEKK